MTVYLILYLAIIVFWLFTCNQYRGSFIEKTFLLLSSMSMALIVGLRSNTVGEDTQHYVNIFRYSQDVSWYKIIHSVGFRTAYFTDQYGYTDTIENGYLILCKVLHYFTNNAQIYLLITAIATFLLIAKFLYDNSTDLFLSTEVILCESFFMTSFNAMRQCLAIAIAVQAYRLIRHRKIKSAILVILIAAFFHNSALVTLVLIPIVLFEPQDKKKAFRIVAIFVVLVPIALIVFQNILVKIFPRYTSYFSVNYWQNTLGGKLVFISIEIVLIILMYLRNFEIEDSYQLSLLCLLGIAFQLVGLKISILDRLGWYFRVYLALFFPTSTRLFEKKTRLYVFGGLMLLLAILYFRYASSDARLYSLFLTGY